MFRASSFLQQKKNPQAKLVRVIKGKVFDVAVDIRRNSNTFGKWISVILSEKNQNQLWIPEGFAHGFLSLDNNTKISYKVDKHYNKESECSVIWNDIDVNIDWPCKKPILSEKDRNALTFNENYKLKNFK